MAKTIVFKPEFEKKLKDLKIKTKFVKNIKQYCKKCNLDFNKYIIWLNNQNNWNAFIELAFTFMDTPEYYTYWKNIANS